MDILRLIKKHSVLLLPIGIALAAILLFVPTLLASKAVLSQMQASVDMGVQIGSLANTTPPANQYKVEQVYQQAHADDANAVSGLIVETSKRELLVYGMFPEPNETSSIIFVNFGKAYRKAIENLVGGLRARDCPSEAEIADVLKHGNGAGNAAFTTGTHNDAIMEQIYMDRADSIPVYANPETFSSYDFWDNYNFIGREEAVEDCWKSQVAYWIQKDVVDTIAVMDAQSSSISKSPVKRLVGFSFTTEFKADMAGKREATVTADAPRYVSETEGMLVIPWTGRKSSDEMDVVHFSFSVVVSNKAVGPFMKELCSRKAHTFKGWSGQDAVQNFFHNQITILKCSIEPMIYTTGMGMDRYRYGDDAVVQMNLVCEYLFSKAGFVIPGGNPPTSIRPTIISEKPAVTNGG